MTQLTIGIPTHNRNYDLKRLLLQLTSILNRYQNIEVIVLNDGGDDPANIQAMINSINKSGVMSQIKFINRAENKHIFWTRLELLEAATGDYFLFIDDDDMIDVLTLSSWIDKLNYHPFVEFSGYSKTYDSIDAFIFNIGLFRHNQTGSGSEYFDRYSNKKTRFLWSTNSVIFNLKRLRHNLGFLRSELTKLYDESKGEKLNLWDDIFTAYHLLGGNKKPNVANSRERLTIVNYDMSNYHISTDYRDTSKKDLSGKYKLYYNFANEK